MNTPDTAEKKRYLTPKLEVLTLSGTDIITTSNTLNEEAIELPEVYW